MKTYKHAGCSAFDMELFEPILNNPYFTKPHGGLWASDINSTHSWSKWCTSEQFQCQRLEIYFLFTLSENARVCTIDSMEKFNAIAKEFAMHPQPENLGIFGAVALDFEKLATQYDAIEVILSEDYHLLNQAFPCWDCDSLLVFNPDVVVPV